LAICHVHARRSTVARLTLLSFLLEPYGAPPDLRSFPTRRSSDLGRSCCCMNKASAERRPPWITPTSSFLPSKATCSPGYRSDPRSEEHTSELQSRVDLVCRLLLEKKKYTQQNSIDQQHRCTDQEK